MYHHRRQNNDTLLTFRTLAHIRSNYILASVWAGRVGRRALVDVLAVDAVGREGVPVGARAAERAERVVAAERAGRSPLGALVDVHARL